MVHSGVFATSDEIVARAGPNYDSTNITEARINAMCLHWESYLSDYCSYNWTDWWATAPNVDVKYILSLFEAAAVAADIIATNMSGYTSRYEAQTMLDYLTDIKNDCLKILKEKSKQTFMQDA